MRNAHEVTRYARHILLGHDDVLNLDFLPERRNEFAIALRRILERVGEVLAQHLQRVIMDPAHVELLSVDSELLLHIGRRGLVGTYMQYRPDHRVVFSRNTLA